MTRETDNDTDNRAQGEAHGAPATASIPAPSPTAKHAFAPCVLDPARIIIPAGELRRLSAIETAARDVRAHGNVEDLGTFTRPVALQLMRALDAPRVRWDRTEARRRELVAIESAAAEGKKPPPAVPFGCEDPERETASAMYETAAQNNLALSRRLARSARSVRVRDRGLRGWAWLLVAALASRVMSRAMRGLMVAHAKRGE